MHKLWNFLVFVLLSHEAFSFRIKRQWVDEDGNVQATKPTTNSDSMSKSIILQDCLRSCPVTTEYNPVCGTDNITYDNPGRLRCAQSCGLNVTQMRASKCPIVTLPPTPAPVS